MEEATLTSARPYELVDNQLYHDASVGKTDSGSVFKDNWRGKLIPQTENCVSCAFNDWDTS